MLRLRLFLVVLVSVLLVGGSIALWAVTEDDKVPLSDVPKTVIDAANKAVPGGEITGAEMEIVDGAVIYDIIKTVDGVEYEIEITADGNVQEVEKGGEEDDKDIDENEEEVPLTDVPAEVLKAAESVVPNGKATDAEKEVEDGVVVYEVEVVVKYKVEVTADGKVRKIEIGEDDEEDADEEGDDEAGEEANDD